jgi:predicted RNA-binding Zn-ribbon protein involved in translation (DUF1610 family)
LIVAAGHMVEDWYEKLRCPKCGKTGMASVALPKGRKTPLPRGFTVVKTRKGRDFHCKKCGVAVE